MAIIKSAIIHEMEESIERLRKELEPLQNILTPGTDTGMYITHDGDHTIVVHGTHTNKAYVPRRYDGWDIHFVVWDPRAELDIDEEIYVG